MSEDESQRNGVIRTLIVDDSAFVRKVVREMLLRSPFIEVVGMAHDGEEALEMTARLKPDVVTCDLMMPAINGVEFVRRQMGTAPLPILILSASAGDGALVLEALNSGAVDFVQKPTARASDQLLGVREELIEKVKAAARVRFKKLPAERPGPSQKKAPSRPHQYEVVVVGISTGGPQALRYLVPRLPPDLAIPVLIVLHMPVGYTALFAEKLAELSQIKVCEAQDRQVLAPGTVVIARAGRHLHVRRNSLGQAQLHLSSIPAGKPHCPSVDVLFRSAAETFGSRTLAVVMTGMGDDGKEGAAWIKAGGGTVLTEAEESCIIYGMPRSVDEAGLSDRSAPLTLMLETILNYL